MIAGSCKITLTSFMCAEIVPEPTPIELTMEVAKNQFQISSLGGKKTVDEKILLPYHHLALAPAVKTRAMLGLALNYWLDIPESKLNFINEMVEILYNYGLLVDDFEDDTAIRRGKPVANKIYGISATIKSANYAFSIGIERCMLLEKPQALEICTRYMLDILRGTGWDCYWRDNWICPTVEEFLRLSDSTPSYFLMTLELMQLFSKNKQDYLKLVRLVGKYYQVRNDYLNLWSEKYMQYRNSYYGDITDSKFSFPITYAINNSPKSEEIIDILKLKTTDIEVKKYCMSLIEECGTKQYTRNTLDDFLSQAFDEIRKFGGNPMLEKFIAGFTVTDES